MTDTSSTPSLLQRVLRTIQSKSFTLFFNGYRAWAKRNMALPTETLNHDCFEIEVVSADFLAPRLRRIVVTAPQFADWELSGADEYFGLVIPPEGKPLVLPAAVDNNIRQALHDIDEKLRPTLRWYTIRELNHKKRQCVIDIVTHGETGPGSAWALNAKPGMKAGFRTIGSTWQDNNGPQLLVADPTSAPAVRAIIDHASDALLATTDIIVVAESAEELEPGLSDLSDKVASLSVIFAPRDEQPAAAVTALEKMGKKDYLYAWACGEATLAKQVRRLLVKDWGLEKTRVLFSGYWRKDRAHG